MNASRNSLTHLHYSVSGGNLSVGKDMKRNSIMHTNMINMRHVIIILHAYLSVALIYNKSQSTSTLASNGNTRVSEL